MESQKLYDTESILTKCEGLEEKNEFIKYVSEVINEKSNYVFLYRLYKLFKKEFIISILKKTLDTMNDGGLAKNNITNEEVNRTIGGTFIYYVKKSDLVSKDLIKNIFWRNKQKKKMNKKLNKQFNKLNISHDTEETTKKEI